LDILNSRVGFLSVEDLTWNWQRFVVAKCFKGIFWWRLLTNWHFVFFQRRV